MQFVVILIKNVQVLKKMTGPASRRYRNFHDRRPRSVTNIQIKNLISIAGQQR